MRPPEPVITEVLLVQTADAVGARLRAALSQRTELRVVDEVPDIRSAVESAERLQPGVIVMDVGLSDVAGNDVLQSIREVAPGARTVLHARAADVDAPGGSRWSTQIVQVVLDPAHAGLLEARLELPDEPRSVPVARAFVSELLKQWDREDFLDSGALLVSELVANAVRHVPGPCALELTHHGDLLRVAVVDSGPGMPDLQALGPDSLGGRGLHIVTSLSTTWGVDHLDGGGKVVWAELDSAQTEKELPDPGPVTSPPRHPKTVLVPASVADLRELLGIVREKLGVDVVTVLRLDLASNHLVTMVTDSAPRVSSVHHRVPVGSGLAGRVAALRSPIALDDVSDDDLVNPALLELGVRSVLGLPLLRGERLQGVIKVGTRRPRHFGLEDIERAQALVDDVGLALDDFVAAEERSAAAALQRSLVPTRLPALEGLQMAGRYVPGQGGVSGDWYDVFELPGGRVGMVMGDVAGHGLPASVVMGRLRSALRAYSLEYDDPAEVLRRLDAKIFHFEPGAMATAIYAVAEPPFDELRIASAGHLLPILASPGGVAAQVDVPVSLPLGVEPSCERISGVVDFRDQSTLVLFTDGLIERRATSTPRAAEVFGSIDSALAEMCALVQPEAAELACSRILDSMLTLEPPGDDVAVLVVRRWT